jgi:hypothetical protein
MEDQNILSPGVFKSHNPNENWKTPVRVTVRTLRRDRAYYGQVIAKTGLTRSTI